ncbi:MAG: tetratricopeptide repeat protein [Polaromonas sp.]
MHARIFTLVAAFTLLGCATQPTQSAYNLGVNAYQAKNYVVAREQWSKAIEAGDTSALNNLGYLLYFGLGGTPDSTRAVALWKRAATAGHSEAQWHLGYAYETGNGVQQSNTEAYAWYRCAIVSASQAHPDDKEAEAQISQDAAQSLGKLLERLPADQFAAAEQLAKQYTATYSQRKPGV